MFQFTDQLRHLAECLATGRPLRVPPENSIAQMRVIDAVFESIRTGEAVRLAGTSGGAGGSDRP